MSALSEVGIPIFALRGLEFLLGTFIGSFLNVSIFRLPREQSLVRPRSRCPHCTHSIAWYDNIPLVSFACLRAKCRHCGRPISWRYPLVELLTGSAAVAVLGRFGLGAAGLIYAAFVAALIAVSFIDLEFQIIPDEISIYGCWTALACSFFVPALHETASRELAVGRALIGAVVGGGLLYGTGAAGDVMLVGLRRLGVCLRRRPFWRKRLARYRHMKESMGGGDVKLMAMAGAVLGWKAVAVAFFLAPFLGVLPGLVMLAVRRSHYIPYGPFLSAGLVLSLFFGQDILRLTGIEDAVRSIIQW